MRAATFLAALGVSCAIAGGGCGSDNGAGSGGSAAGSSGTETGSGGSGSACDPACQAPQFCSVTRVCLDPGSCAADGDCTEPGKVCDLQTNTCVPGGACGSQEILATPVAPNLLIALDRSCSMDNNVTGTGMTKWAISIAAIDTMLTSYANQIRFGLTLFPDRGDGAQCQQNAPFPFYVGPGNEAAISALLNAALDPADNNFPDGPCVTNIDTAMEQAATDPGLADPERDSYILLLTDGKQAGCNAAGGDAGTTTIIDDLFQNKGVGTFVLGFGSGVDPAQLDIFANAGGVPSTGANQFYDAADQMSLDAALNTIANKTLGCSFTLDQVPPNPEEIYVFQNNMKVGRDPTHMSGWDYDPATNQVTFYGANCDDLKAGVVTDVDIVLGCDQPTPD